MTEKEVLKAAILQYGETMQRMKLIEEMAELTQALIKECLFDCEDEIKGEKIQENIHEETADVLILLDQLLMTLDLEKVLKYKQMKIDRLALRLSK